MEKKKEAEKVALREQIESKIRDKTPKTLNQAQTAEAIEREYERQKRIILKGRDLNQLTQAELEALDELTGHPQDTE